MLDALEDPDRFAVANELLWQELLWQEVGAGPPGGGEPGLDRQRRRAWIYNDGIRVEFPPGAARLNEDGIPYGDGWDRDPFAPGVRRTQYNGPGIYDPSQLQVLQDYWFDRLAQPVVSAPFPPVVALVAGPGLLELGVRARRLYVRRRRHRLGRCLRCGYELTGNTSGKCSECGEAVQA